MAMPNDTFIRRWFEEVWNQGNEDTIDEMLAHDIVVHGIGDSPGADLIGPEAFKAHFRRFRGAFPQIHVAVEDTVTEEGKIVARFSVSARHEGEGFGILPTNKLVAFAGVVIAHLRDHRIVEAWNFIDFAAMHQQIAGK
jgi:predicted ester cyclase